VKSWQDPISKTKYKRAKDTAQIIEHLSGKEGGRKGRRKVTSSKSFNISASSSIKRKD
jgi:hypothetical protein